MGTVTEIHVLGQGIVLPAPGIHDALLAPDSPGAVEGEEAAAPVAGGLLEFQVSVEKHGLHPGEQVVIPVQMPPARLDETDLIVREVMNGLLEDVGVRHKIGVKDEHIVPLGGLEPVLQRPGLEPAPVVAVNQLGVEPARLQLLDLHLRDPGGLVGRVVEKLDLELVLGIVQPRDGGQQPLHHVHFIEDRQLNRHQRQFLEASLHPWTPPRVLQVKVDDAKSMTPVPGEPE